MSDLKSPQPNQPMPGQPQIVHQIQIALVVQDGGMGIVFNTSADPIVTLGILEMTKKSIMEQAQQPKSPLVVASGRVPRA